MSPSPALGELEERGIMALELEETGIMACQGRTRWRLLLKPLTCCGALDKSTSSSQHRTAY